MSAASVAAASLLAASALLSPSIGLAQSVSNRTSGATPERVAADSFVTVVPAPQFKRGAFFRFFWGTDYRKEWNTRVRAPVLDLQTFARGLTLVEEGGPGQTRTLFFEGADGRRYAFRSIVKSLGASLPGVVGDLEGAVTKTPIGIVMGDLNSALHPAAPIMADSLEAAADVVHFRPQPYVMPNSESLGEYRQEFGDMLGTIVPVTGAGVIDSDELFTRVRRSPRDRVDARALLTARLIDMLIGDWDRDRRQWQWIRRIQGEDWQPIARDRDEAFVRLDGLLPSNMHFVKPQLVGFNSKYPSIVGLTYTGQELDRQFLSGLERPTWDSIAASVTARLTNEVLAGAVRTQPTQMYAIGGNLLVFELEKRRDALQRAAADFYEILARDAEVTGTDAAETAWITGLEDGGVEVILAERAEGSPAYFQRRFHPSETNEIRISLHGGDDVALVRGDPGFHVRVRIIGGEGDDEFRFVVPARRVSLYDQHGKSRVTGEAGGRKVNDRPYREWEFSDEKPIPPRDWGSRWFPTGRALISSDFGLFVGLGAQRLTYAFRKDPYSTRLRMLGGISTDGKVAFETDYDTRFENSRSRIRSRALISQLTQTHFYGFGNATLNPPDVDSGFFDVDRTVVAAEIAGAHFPTLSEKMDAALGVRLSLSITGENEGKFISLFPDLYGLEDFAQVGFFLDFDLDTRDIVSNPTKGARIYVRGTAHPAWLDAVDAYVPLDVMGAYYVTPRIPLRPTLAFRAGSRIVWGQFPYFQAAYIGGMESLRGWASQRFAGDVSLYGGMDLRLKVVEIEKFLPGPFGVLGLIDVGRVWVDGRSSDGFHLGYGGGIWTGFLGRGQTVSVSVALSEEQTSVYVTYGFAF
ncbi:MAG: BamA/TamA family outer membrane protein [Gemmatimonadales bacterium]|jgi:hypothetical protein